jgi:hypothetical protein
VVFVAKRRRRPLSGAIGYASSGTVIPLKRAIDPRQRVQVM